MRFFVEGRPRPAGSKRAVATHRVTGKTILADMSGPAGVRWRRAVAQAALVASAVSRSRRLGGRGPMLLDVTFRLRRPTAHFTRAGDIRPEFILARPTSAPDTTKLLRAVEDALTGILWQDDAQVVEQTARKVYVVRGAPEGASIEVLAL